MWIWRKREYSLFIDTTVASDCLVFVVHVCFLCFLQVNVLSPFTPSMRLQVSASFLKDKASLWLVQVGRCLHNTGCLCAALCVHVCFIVLTMPCISQEISDVSEAQIYRSRSRCWEAAGVELELTGELSIRERAPGLSHHTTGGRAPWQQNCAASGTFPVCPLDQHMLRKEAEVLPEERSLKSALALLAIFKHRSKVHRDVQASKGQHFYSCLF